MPQFNPPRRGHAHGQFYGQGSFRQSPHDRGLRATLLRAPFRFAFFRTFSVEENEALEIYSADVLSQDGSIQTDWTSPDGQVVTMSTGEPEQVDRDVDFAYDDDIAPPSAGTRIEAETYVVEATRLNFRSEPVAGGDGNIIGYFDKGENIEVIGRTPDGRWALVGEQGVVVGYAAFVEGGKDLLLTPEDAAVRHRTAIASVAPSDRARPKRVAHAATTGVGSKVTRQADSPNERIAVNSVQVKKVKVQASTVCKALAAQTGNVTDTKTGCVGSDGKWAIS